jgi:hypothetical protein
MLGGMDVRGKLQIRPGQSVSVLKLPSDLVWQVESSAARPDAADVVIGFAVTRQDLESLDAVFDAARADRLAWIGYPKGGKLGTDLNRDKLAEAVTSKGVQPVRQVSIDETWSALRFRPG